jgi:hypothetical protein
MVDVGCSMKLIEMLIGDVEKVQGKEDRFLCEVGQESEGGDGTMEDCSVELTNYICSSKVLFNHDERSEILRSHLVIEGLFNLCIAHED